MKLNRNIISLIVAIALGALVVVLVNFYLAKEKKRLALEREKQLGKEVSVVLASGNIPRGAKITNAMVKIGTVREANLQPRTITNLESAIGKVAIADIVSGEQISSTKLMSETSPIAKEKPISGSNLAMKIPSGTRAFTIAIDDISAAGGMIRPNDYVDIIGTFPFTQVVEGKQVTQNVSVTLFQNVLVLAVGRQTGPEETGAAKAGGGNTITFALNLQQVELLNFAQDIGKLKLILRPPLETQTQSIPPVTADILWQQILTQAGMQLPSQPAKQEGPSAMVEIYRGKEKEVVPIE
ncbi:MAG: Flp pilus assembly protein CpaB [Candidatus Omnitrophota bacterium]